MLCIAHYTRIPGSSHRTPTSIITTTKPTALPRSTPPSTTPNKIPSASTQHPSSAARTITEPHSSPQPTIHNEKILQTVLSSIFPPLYPRCSIFYNLDFRIANCKPILPGYIMVRTLVHIRLPSYQNLIY